MGRNMQRFVNNTLFYSKVYLCLMFLFFNFYEGWDFNSGNYLFTTDTK